MERLNVHAENIPAAAALSGTARNGAGSQGTAGHTSTLYLKKKFFFSTSLEIDATPLELNLDFEGRGSLSCAQAGKPAPATEVTVRFQAVCRAWGWRGGQEHTALLSYSAVFLVGL